MLSLIRGFAKSKIAVGLLFLTMFGLLVTGSTNFFGGGGGGRNDSNFVHAGDVAAGRPEFTVALNNLMRQVQENQPDVTPAQLAGDPGVVAEIQNRLSNRTTLIAFGEQSGLKLDAGAAVRELNKDPNFKNGLGQLDQQKINNAMSELNFPNADRFNDYVRGDVQQQYLQSAALAGLKPPGILTNPVADMLAEQRTIAVAVFTPEATPKPTTPTEQELRDHYKANIATYAVAETRAFSVLQVSPMDYIGRVKVTDEQVKADYDKRIKQFSSPETRELTIVKAADRAKIQAVVDLVKQGKPLADAIAATPGATAETKSVQPGFTTEKDLDKATFLWPANVIQGPAQSEGQWSAFLVKSITPGTPMPLDEPRKDEIRRDLAFPEARKTYEQAAEEAVDGLAAGRTMEELAKDLGAPILSLQAIDPSGRTENGQPQRLLAPYLDKSPLESQQTLLAAAFQMQLGGLPLSIDADFCPPPEEPTKATCRSRLIIKLDAITPPHTRPFEEVRDEVEIAWNRAKLTDGIKKIADGVIADVKAGKDFQAVAKAAKLRYEAVPQPVDRLTQGIDQSIVEMILALGKGEIAALPINERQGDPRPTMIYIVDAKKIDRAARPEIAGLADRLTRRDLSNDLSQSLLRGAALKTKPMVNAAALQAYADTLAGKAEAPQ